ncbi:MAG: hypothetical protein ACUVTN_04020 [Thermodesulfobacteriota bacterium]
MDKTLMEWMEQGLLVFSKKEDVEKLRQEILSHFFKLREENQAFTIRVIKEIKEELEKLNKDLRSQFLESYETQTERKIMELSHSFHQEMERGFQFTKGELEKGLDRLRKDIDSNIQKLKEEPSPQKAYSNEELGVHFQGIREGMENLHDQMKRIGDEMATFREKLKEGFEGIKEELGSMIRFSYADLEKRLNALEARVNALEKLVLS